MFTRIRRPRSATTVLAATAVSALLAGTVLAGCSGGASSSGASAESAADAAGGGAAAENLSAHKPASRGSDSASGADSTLLPDGPRYRIKTGSIDLVSPHVGSVVDKVRGVAAGLGGGVAQEHTSTNRHGTPTYSRLTVRVPVGQFEVAMKKLSGLGQLADRSQNSKDVTTKVADVKSRVQNAQASIERLRTLYRHATKVGDIISVESELQQREAELESLQAQQRALAGKTTMSRIHVTVDHQAAPRRHHDEQQAGFLAGITSGWHALQKAAVGFAHVVGLVLPLGLVLVLIAAGVFVVVRRVRTRISH